MFDTTKEDLKDILRSVHDGALFPRKWGQEQGIQPYVVQEVA